MEVDTDHSGINSTILITHHTYGCYFTSNVSYTHICIYMCTHTHIGLCAFMHTSAEREIFSLCILTFHYFLCHCIYILPICILCSCPCFIALCINIYLLKLLKNSGFTVTVFRGNSKLKSTIFN